MLSKKSLRTLGLVMIASALTLGSLATKASPASENAKALFTQLVSEDLLQVQRNDVYGKAEDQIKAQNEAMFQMLRDYQPRTEVAQRKDSVDRDFAALALASINQHPVVSEYNIFDRRNGMQIGFCFGRATYVHLALLRAGVNKDAIKKIWAVGPMKTGDITWQFHVGTMVKGPGDEWLVVDTFVRRVMTPQEWFATMQGIATDKTLRFYVTNPEKFSVSLGKYSRIELGLDLSSEQDWYSHYFKDLMTWMQAKPMSEVGLYDLRTGRPPVTE